MLFFSRVATPPVPLGPWWVGGRGKEGGGGRGGGAILWARARVGGRGHRPPLPAPPPRHGRPGLRVRGSAFRRGRGGGCPARFNPLDQADLT